MATVRQITTMCRDGQIEEAYQLARTDLNIETTAPFPHICMGWALYYTIKSDVEAGRGNRLCRFLSELAQLDRLTMSADSMIFENILFKISEYLRLHLEPTSPLAQDMLYGIFGHLKQYQFPPSKSYSYLLQSIIKFENWPGLADFLDYWHLDNLRQEDYTPYINQRGQKSMALAERAYIANTKALLKLNDQTRIDEFLPRLNDVMEEHPEMMWLGYCYAKLLLVQGTTSDETMNAIIPFARRKASEYWVWDLLSDIFANDEEKHVACLLRAVHCRTQEHFLKNVRIKLATYYVRHAQYNRARFHIDAVTRCVASNGWRLPYEIQNWTQQPWLNTATPDGNAPMDYMAITDEVLCHGSEECIAVVTYVDPNSHKASLVYGHEKRMVQRLRLNVSAGNVVKMYYTTEGDGRIHVLSARKVQLPDGLNYVKHVEGTVDKKDTNDFAFLKSGRDRCFVSPAIVNRHNLRNGERIKCLAVYDYNKRKEVWNWVCLKIMN